MTIEDKRLTDPSVRRSALVDQLRDSWQGKSITEVAPGIAGIEISDPFLEDRDNPYLNSMLLTLQDVLVETAFSSSARVEMLYSAAAAFRLGLPADYFIQEQRLSPDTQGQDAYNPEVSKKLERRLFIQTLNLLQITKDPEKKLAITERLRKWIPIFEGHYGEPLAEQHNPAIQELLAL